MYSSQAIDLGINAQNTTNLSEYLVARKKRVLIAMERPGEFFKANDKSDF